MFLARRDLPVECKLRYDAWVTPATHLELATGIELAPTQGLRSPYLERAHPYCGLCLTTRPIFCSYPTPDGRVFMQWLHTPPRTPALHAPVPTQMEHRPSELDSLLLDDETAMRAMDPEELLKKTAKAFEMWWRIADNTLVLHYFEKQGNGYLDVETVF
ncbi:hypothetical protein K504DRAFT_459608 [Pleomassaria siparia CBS 279.74]|uniref:Uncharacterized protein n=1 Tax=Pleomassaria siparia CBS 279.74 TaxID=1314801 RepID=A0A6G1K1C4_9PLEO|nr:hypothetical protein K504DRAFT_459608 [Pleomassaria siparia CBS 279.74]